MTVLKMFNRNGYDQAVNFPVHTFSNLVNDFINFDDYHPAYLNKLPKANVIEEKEAFLINLAVPGVKKSDIKMEVDKDVLTVSHSSEKKDDDIIYSSKEFNFEDFERKFRLPETADIRKINAKYDDGILCIEIPKMKDAIDKGPREIKIS
jgi:HSP20 family protein